MEDPYDDLVIPSFDPTDCDRDGGNKEYTAIDGETFEAGGGIFVICGGLKVSSGDTLFLESGTYILDQGDFLINGNSFIFGEDVTFILTNSDDPDDVGSVSVNGGGTVELSAPTSDLTDADGYSGVLFYQDRAGDTKSNKSNTFNGGAEVDLQGVLYFPSNDLDFSGGAEAGSGCMQLISLTVNIGGSAGVQGNCDNAGTRKGGRLKASLGE